MVTGVCRVGVTRRAVGVARVGEAWRVAVAEVAVLLRGCCAVVFTERRAASVVLRAVAVVARPAGAVRGLSTVRRPVLVVAAERCGVRPATLFAASRLAAGVVRLAAAVRLTEEPMVPAYTRLPRFTPFEGCNRPRVEVRRRLSP